MMPVHILQAASSPGMPKLNANEGMIEGPKPAYVIVVLA